jgi:hypothetical protein
MPDMPDMPYMPAEARGEAANVMAVAIPSALIPFTKPRIRNITIVNPPNLI